MMASVTRKRAGMKAVEVTPSQKITNYFQRILGPVPPSAPAPAPTAPASKSSAARMEAAGSAKSVPPPVQEEPLDFRVVPDVNKIANTKTQPMDMEPKPKKSCTETSPDNHVKPNANDKANSIGTPTPKNGLSPAPTELTEHISDSRASSSLKISPQVASVAETEEEAVTPGSESPPPIIQSTSTTLIQKAPKKMANPVKVHYSCPHCKKIFQFFNQFVRHLRTHNPDDPEGAGVSTDSTVSSSISQSQIIMESALYLEEIGIRNRKYIKQLQERKTISIVEPCPEFRVKTEFESDAFVPDVKPFLTYIDVKIPRCKSTYSGLPAPASTFSGTETESPRDNGFTQADDQDPVPVPDTCMAEDDDDEEQLADTEKENKTSASVTSAPVPNQVIKSSQATCEHCKRQFHHTSLPYHLENRVCLKVKVKPSNQLEKKRKLLKKRLKKNKLKQLRVKCQNCKINFSQDGIKYHRQNRVCYKIMARRKLIAEAKAKKALIAEARVKAKAKMKLTSEAIPKKKLAQQKPEIGQGRMEFKCEFCQSVFKKKERLKEHRRVHTGEKPHTCRHCPKTFSTTTGRLHHEKIHARALRPYSCQHCKMRFSIKSNLKVHIRLHTGEKPYVCQYCSKAFVRSSALNLHKMRMHPSGKAILRIRRSRHQESAPVTVTVRGGKSKRTKSGAAAAATATLRRGKPKSTKSVISAIATLRRGKPESTKSGAAATVIPSSSPYKCEHCGKTYAQNAGLIYHLRTHTGERPYSCKYCRKTFRSNSSLTVHTRSHTGENLNSCKYCRKRFSTKSSLKVHTRVHTGEMPYSCAHCGLKFRYFITLKKHKQTEH